MQTATDNCSQTDSNNGAVAGAVVVTVLFIISITVAVAVIVMLVLRNHKIESYNTQTKYTIRCYSLYLTYIAI